MRVSQLLIEALEVALRAAELTDGDVDPTVGRALELAGYDRDWRLLEPPATPRARDAAAAERPSTVAARTVRGLADGRARSRARRVRMPARHSRWTSGATAKALGGRSRGAAAAQAAGCGVLVSLGGDIATCGPAPARAAGRSA